MALIIIIITSIIDLSDEHLSKVCTSFQVDNFYGNLFLDFIGYQYLSVEKRRKDPCHELIWKSFAKAQKIMKTGTYYFSKFHDNHRRDQDYKGVSMNRINRILTTSDAWWQCPAFQSGSSVTCVSAGEHRSSDPVASLALRGKEDCLELNSSIIYSRRGLNSLADEMNEWCNRNVISGSFRFLK